MNTSSAIRLEAGWCPWVRKSSPQNPALPVDWAGVTVYRGITSPSAGSGDCACHEGPSMKQMTTSLVVFVVAFLFLVGCTGQQGSSTLDLGGPSGTITWSASAQKEKPQQGIDQPSIYYEGTTLVVWSDFDGGGGGSSSSNVQGVK